MLPSSLSPALDVMLVSMTHSNESTCIYTSTQDRLFQAADITSSFKALASVDLPDDDAALQQREEFLTELCDLTASALSALHPAQLVTLLWSCGRCCNALILSRHPV